MTDITVDKERIYKLLCEADDRLTDLGLDLMHKWERMTGDSLGWDPDAYYTPLENVLHHIAELFGWDYNEDIAKEAYHNRLLERAFWADPDAVEAAEDEYHSGHMTDDEFWKKIGEIDRGIRTEFQWHTDGDPNAVCWHCANYMQFTETGKDGFSVRPYCTELDKAVFKDSTCKHFRYRPTFNRECPGCGQPMSIIDAPKRIYGCVHCQKKYDVYGKEVKE